jgi:hypothetical protein
VRESYIKRDIERERERERGDAYRWSEFKRRPAIERGRQRERVE